MLKARQKLGVHISDKYLLHCYELSFRWKKESIDFIDCNKKCSSDRKSDLIVDHYFVFSILPAEVCIMSTILI